jgi:alpha-D-xyloside xylohydrolase
MWNDIDYMDNYLDYTTDPVNYPENEMRAFSEQLHANGQHYIVRREREEIQEDIGIKIN